MPWQKKATSPAFVNAGDAFAALITGDANWGWLIDWIPLMGNEVVDVTKLCAQGPAPAANVTPSDFALGDRNPLARIANGVLLAAKLRALAYDRIFGAYCESSVAVATTICSPWFTIDVAGSVAPPWQSYWDIPRGASALRMNVQNVNAQTLLQMLYDTGAGAAGPGVPPYHYFPWPQGVLSGTYNASPFDGTYTRCGGGVESHGSPLHAEFQFCADVSSTAYTPTAPTAPTGVTAHTHQTYSTIGDLGAELDRQELKLDYLGEQIRFLAAQATVGGTVSDPAPIDATAGASVDVSAAVGAIVTLSSVPAGSTEAFGDPPRLYTRSRLELGTDAAWYPPVDIAHSPLVVMPLPLQCTRLRVRVVPPTTAAVTRLFPPK